MGVIHLTGTLTCPSDRLVSLRAALPEHIRLTRAEPGCLRFDVSETAPGRFAVTEAFANRAAYDAHQNRTQASPWAQITEGLPRDYTLHEE